MNTKRYLLRIAAMMLFSAGGMTPVAGCSDSAAGLKELPDACTLLTQADAERILGQPANVSVDTTPSMHPVHQLRCTYTALAADSAGRPITLYFSVEQKEPNPSVEQAHEMFASTLEMNLRNGAVKVGGIGDEAYEHSQVPNFHFLMVRKGPVIIRFKINKAPEPVSMDELKAFARKVADGL